MAFLDGPRDATGGPDGPPGVWLLVPSDAQESRPMVDGAPVPDSPPRKMGRHSLGVARRPVLGGTTETRRRPRRLNSRSRRAHSENTLWNAYRQEKRTLDWGR